MLESKVAVKPNKDLNKVMREYARYFFEPSLAEATANGILALEKNWVGPLEENGGVETTFSFWQNLELKNPQLKNNWRWQQLMMRCYYDTYDRRRKFNEQGLEKKANEVLGKAAVIGADKAMDDALLIVNEADKNPVYPALRQRIVDYCDALFKSIGLQTSVKK